MSYTPPRPMPIDGLVEDLKTLRDLSERLCAHATEINRRMLDCIRREEACLEREWAATNFDYRHGGVSADYNIALGGILLRGGRKFPKDP